MSFVRALILFAQQLGVQRRVGPRSGQERWRVEDAGDGRGGDRSEDRRFLP